MAEALEYTFTNPSTTRFGYSWSCQPQAHTHGGAIVASLRSTPEATALQALMSRKTCAKHAQKGSAHDVAFSSAVEK